jgi:branched-chain amino acid transport system permease protein
LGIFIEWAVYKPLSKKSNNQNIILISSLGVYIVLVNCIALVFGNETKLLDNTLYQSYSWVNIILTHSQFYQLIFSIPVILLFIFFLQFTSFGLKIRAVANNSVLATVVGIKMQRVRYMVIGLGSVMAVGAGLLKAFDTGIDPYSGMAITLSAAVVVIVGGERSIYGTLIASILLAIIQNYTEYFLSAQWREAVTFIILIIVLLWRTEGILQFSIRADER